MTSTDPVANPEMLSRIQALDPDDWGTRHRGAAPNLEALAKLVDAQEQATVQGRTITQMCQEFGVSAHHVTALRWFRQNPEHLAEWWPRIGSGRLSITQAYDRARATE